MLGLTQLLKILQLRHSSAGAAIWCFNVSKITNDSWLVPSIPSKLYSSTKYLDLNDFYEENLKFIY